MPTYNVLGMMSGSSLDGLDLALCKLEESEGRWTYDVLSAETIDYPHKWKLRLTNLVLQNAITYLKTDAYLGHYWGELVADYVERNDLFNQIDFIASHGQTIFHQPENGVTSQIGLGSAIAAKTGLPVVCDFRTNDIAHGGQGTPIVPIGERHLFTDHKMFLNLGGIANISVHSTEKAIAYDICPVNIVLNKLASELGQEIDENGENAAAGNLSDSLLEELNGLWYYAKEHPKSLGGGWVSKVMMPVVRRSYTSTVDKLRTVVEHIALQIGSDINSLNENYPKLSTSVLVTGGGSFNSFLMERLAEYAALELVVPDIETVNFKEAIVIALMGALRVENKVNCLCSVTGASVDTVGGVLYQGLKKQI